MRKIVEIAAGDVVPDSCAVLERLSFPPDAVPDERTASLLRQAIPLFRSLSRPAGVLMQVDAKQFEVIYHGEGRNEPATPLEGIFPEAEKLALFAVTIGHEVSARINELFETRDFALASVLDAVASEATEIAADLVQREFHDLLREQGKLGPSTKLLRYSPGYCGWHISGQRALFDTLKPGEIGLTLRESFLMEPLKSISGLIIGGSSQIHDFEDGYPFCIECKTRGCRERIRRIYEN